MKVAETEIKVVVAVVAVAADPDFSKAQIQFSWTGQEPSACVYAQPLSTSAGAPSTASCMTGTASSLDLPYDQVCLY